MARRRHAPVRSGDEVEVVIDRLAAGGRGVARHDGFVLFVQRALPGDRVLAQVGRVKRSHAEARAIKVLEPGPDSITPPCPYVGRCGGCAWQRLDYDAQVRVKAEQVREGLVRIGKVEDPPMLDIIPASSTFGYRNRVDYTFTSVEGEDGSERVELGFHRAGAWNEVIPVDPCLIADERGVPVRRVVARWATEHGVPVHDRETGEGVLRACVVRVGRATGEVQVTILTTPAPEGLPKAAELVDDLQSEIPGLVGVLHAQSDSRANVSVGDGPPEVLHGRDWFTECLAGHDLKVHANAFLQTNTEMAERLYELVLETAELRPDDVVWDLYCGIGSITLAVAPHVQTVVGVEVVEEAVESARENAELNGIENVEFQAGNARPVLKAAMGVWPDPTLVIVDPPRAGLVPKVVRRVAELKPERIVYVSCNPQTFAADVARFAEHGYAPVSVRPIDQFPHTPHCELVSRLEPIPGWQPPVEEDAAAEAAEGDA